MKFTALQVIELYRAMADWRNLSVDGNGDTIQQPTSPEVRRVIDSMCQSGDIPIDGWECRGELFTHFKPKCEQLKAFFQACADALPVTGQKHEST